MIDFVGAGCGAPDLITVRGKALLEAADLVVYAGSLVNPALLDYTGPGCKRLDSAKMTLDEVVEALAAAHRAGQRAVRLHSGDPSIYGAIREQMDRLEALGIGYRVCPGVSALCGAAAALKAEYTLPGVSQTVIITRMAGRTPVPPGESLSALAAHGATLVIFLSAGLLEEVAAALQAGGLPPDTPAALVYRASWADEKVCRCTVGTLAQTGRENGISKTALICVGHFLGEDYQLSRLYDGSFATGFREARP
ncbi:precorrin-4 C(11)-methyltransferase [Acutalibacter caecimuris]|uniref:precorrin-4 C(11)-methyltransferase n=1 Tax=Acutalibacter caecimuris TaxID=3093657 RepID=UPI002AC9AB66|nr:precorrin-4 C(11)-methyltransferase [Acutalibacter sp. M00118]